VVGDDPVSELVNPKHVDAGQDVGGREAAQLVPEAGGQCPGEGAQQEGLFYAVGAAGLEPATACV
jgi:hypothetical protein